VAVSCYTVELMGLVMKNNEAVFSATFQGRLRKGSYAMSQSWLWSLVGSHVDRWVGR
jgi:hypothetical protein